MITRTFTFGIDGGDSLVRRVSPQAGSEHILSEAVPAPSTNMAVAFAAIVAKLKWLYMVCDQDITVETNSGSSPVNTFTLAAGVPFVWTVNNPALRDTAGTAVTTDITGLFITHAGETAGTFELRAGIDPT